MKGSFSKDIFYTHFLQRVNLELVDGRAWRFGSLGDDDD